MNNLCCFISTLCEYGEHWFLLVHILSGKECIFVYSPSQKVYFACKQLYQETPETSRHQQVQCHLVLVNSKCGDIMQHVGDTLLLIPSFTPSANDPGSPSAVKRSAKITNLHIFVQLLHSEYVVTSSGICIRLYNGMNRATKYSWMFANISVLLHF